eukprot:m.792762 g.792762  ORF g.792762 m.792762 type:complete len:69 (+) comp59223_c0_seq7:972-1178(+)
MRGAREDADDTEARESSGNAPSSSISSLAANKKRSVTIGPFNNIIQVLLGGKLLNWLACASHSMTKRP